MIKSNGGKYSKFLTALDTALGQEEFYAAYSDEKIPVIAKAPNLGKLSFIGKAVEKYNRVLTDKTYQKVYYTSLWVQQQSIGKIQRMIGLQNVMPRMLEKAQAKGLDLADFDGNKKEFQDLMAEAVVHYEQVRPTPNSASSQSIAYTSISKALPLDIFFLGWLFSGLNNNVKNIKVLLDSKYTREAKIDAMIYGLITVITMASLIALFRLKEEDDLLTNKDNPTKGGQKNTRATFAFSIPGTDGSINVGDVSQILPGRLSAPTYYFQLYDLITNEGARASYLENLQRQFGLVDSKGAIKPPEAIIGGVIGDRLIPNKTDVNKIAGIFQPNEKSISKANPWDSFVQSLLGANLAATLGDRGLPVGNVPDKQYRIYDEKTKKMVDVSKPRDTMSRLLDLWSPINNENINLNYLNNGIQNAETQLAKDKQSLSKNLASGKISQDEYNQGIAKLDTKQDKYNLDTVLAPSGGSSSGGRSSGGKSKGQSLSSAISGLKSSSKGNRFSIKYKAPAVAKIAKTKGGKSISAKKSISDLGKGGSKTNLKLGKDTGFTNSSVLSKGAKLKSFKQSGGLSRLSSSLGGGIPVKKPNISIKKPRGISISNGTKSVMPKLIPLKGIKANLGKDKKFKP